MSRELRPLLLVLVALAAVLLVSLVRGDPAGPPLPVDAAFTGPAPGIAVQDPEELKILRRRVEPLHERMGPVRPGDWLARHDEKGQTFEQYLRSRPVRPTGGRRILDVLPLGSFSAGHEHVLRRSAEFLGLYFNVRVRLLRTLSLDVIPGEARRRHPRWGTKQVLSTYVLDEVLRPRLRGDALALIAFTSSDLYPDPSWNFVFGQASLRHRVGVWSLYRMGDPGDDLPLCLRRTLKTATHETGHMVSIPHCTAWECNMCGSNGREESDRHPLWLCPECLPKVLWGCRADARHRFGRLRAFCAENGLTTEAAFYGRCLGQLR